MASDDTKKRVNKRNHSKTIKPAQALKPTADAETTYFDSQPLASVKIDLKKVTDFLEVIYPTSILLPDEHPAFWHIENPKYQGLGLPYEPFSEFIRRTTRPTALYMCTSTVTLTKGFARNTIAAFKRFFIVILDDVGNLETSEGAKIDINTIPKDLEPTYILETSKDNFQYGYVLAEGIDVYEHAKALVTLVKATGFTDSGGCSVLKRVRVPEGCHGKTNSADPLFRTRIVKCDEKYYTPQEILDGLNIDVLWEDVQANASEVLREKVRHIGASAYDKTLATYRTTEGAVDCIAEFLSATGRVYGQSENYLSIECPDAKNHTQQDAQSRLAGYSPIGWGETDWQKKTRHFKCFHDSCSAFTTDHFLERIQDMGAPAASRVDHILGMTDSHVFDASNNKIHDITSHDEVLTQSYDSFKNEHCRAPAGAEKLKGRVMTISQLFMHSPNRVDVRGTVYDPSTRKKLVRDGAILRVNTFSKPDYVMGAPDLYHVKMFMDYVSYLIPNPEDLFVFIMWLAAKVQDYTFRGWVMVMVARPKGTGRGTLNDMIIRLLGEPNCSPASAKELTNPDENYNEFLKSPFVYTSEINLSGLTPVQRSKVMNQFKDIFDTRSSSKNINVKWEGRGKYKLMSSHILYTNAARGALVEDGDRRFYVIENPSVPAEPRYFHKINKWMDAKDEKGKYEFVKHVGRFLESLKPDLLFLRGRAPMTDAKRAMSTVDGDMVTRAFLACLEALPTPFFYLKQIRAVMQSQEILHRLNLEVGELGNILNKQVNQLSDSTGLRFKSQRPRVYAEPHELEEIKTHIASLNGKRFAPSRIKYTALIHDKTELIDTTELRKAVLDMLTEEGY